MDLGLMYETTLHEIFRSELKHWLGCDMRNLKLCCKFVESTWTCGCCFETKVHGQFERLCLTNVADLASCIAILLQDVVIVYLYLCIINLTPVLNNSIRE